MLSGDLGTANVNTDNSYHVVTANSAAALDGFTIRGGNANQQRRGDEDDAGEGDVPLDAAA